MSKRKEPSAEAISAVMAALGRRGGPARAQSLSAARRKQIARKAAFKRWGKQTEKAK